MTPSPRAVNLECDESTAVDPSPAIRALGDEMIDALVADPSDVVSWLALCDLLEEAGGAEESLVLLRRPGGFFWSRFFEHTYVLVYGHNKRVLSRTNAVNVTALSRKRAPRCRGCGCTRSVWAPAGVPSWRCDPPLDWLHPLTNIRPCFWCREFQEVAK